MQQKVDVRFKINPKVYSFISFEPVSKGDYVVVETSLGQSLGVVDSTSNTLPENMELKKVLRKATSDDMKQNEKNCEKEHTAIAETKAIVERLKLDMNVVNAEYSFDGSKILIDFISENRVDFRDLVKELAGKLHTRIELRQIGIRDQARMVGGIGICGRVCCCASHLKDFEKVSIKMAKVQELALNPTKISGACGRLMCCLAYENEYYSEVYSKMPRVNSSVKTADGVGTVIYQNMLKQMVSVKFVNGDTSTIKDFSLDEVTSLGNLQNNNKNNNKKASDDGNKNNQNNTKSNQNNTKSNQNNTKSNQNNNKNNQNNDKSNQNNGKNKLKFKKIEIKNGN